MLDQYFHETNECVLHWEHCADAVTALDHLLKMHRIEIVKALDPMKKGDLLRISRHTARALKRATAGFEAIAVRDALQELDVDWPALSPQARLRATQAANRQIRKVLPVKVVPGVQRVLNFTVPPLIEGTKKGAIKRHRLNVPFFFSDHDAQIARLAVQSQTNFVTNEYGKRIDSFSTSVRRVIGAGIERGAGGHEIVQDLRTKVGDFGKLGRGDFYWEVVALAFTNRTRNAALLGSFAEAAFELFRWESILDEVTTEQCRFMHDKVFPISDTTAKYLQAERAKNPEEVKQIQPWVSTGLDKEGNRVMFFRDAEGEKQIVAQIDESGIGENDRIGSYSRTMDNDQLLRAGVSMPPLHGLCRSTVVPEVGSQSGRVFPAPPSPPPPPPKPQAKPKPRPARTYPKQGEHYDGFYSTFGRADEQDVMQSVADIGMLPLLKRQPLGRLVLTDRIAKRSVGKASNMVDPGSYGIYLGEAYARRKRGPDRGKLVHERAVLKLQFDHGSGFCFGRMTATNQAQWSTSQIATKVHGERAGRRTTMAHEMGHHVELAGRQAPQGSSDRAEFDRVQSVIRGAYSRRLHQRTTEPHRPWLTRYAAKNRTEYFAESFAAHASYPDILKSRDPIAFEMVEEVRKIRRLERVARSIDRP